MNSNCLQDNIEKGCGEVSQIILSRIVTSLRFESVTITALLIRWKAETVLRVTLTILAVVIFQRGRIVGFVQSSAWHGHPLKLIFTTAPTVVVEPFNTV